MRPRSTRISYNNFRKDQDYESNKKINQEPNEEPNEEPTDEPNEELNNTLHIHQNIYEKLDYFLKMKSFRSLKPEKMIWKILTLAHAYYAKT